LTTLRAARWSAVVVDDNVVDEVVDEERGRDRIKFYTCRK
jgi:hypothetical protein